jgi:acyl-coenzyme A thioesterase PaaI-like protein
MTPPDHDAAREAAIEASFARQGLMHTLGARIEQITKGKVILSMPITEASAQQHGFAHAGATFALGDSASGYAALSLMDPGAEVSDGRDEDQPDRPGLGRTPRGRGRGRETGTTPLRGSVDGRSVAEDGTQRDVALLQGTMIPA